MEENPYPSFRARIFEVTAENLGLDTIAENEPFAFFTEFRIEGIIITIVVFLDGSVSIYFETGMMMIGGGEHQQIRDIGFELLKTCHELEGVLQDDKKLDHPKKDQVKFFIRTKQGTKSCVIKEKHLNKENNPGAYQYMLVNMIITEFRKIDQKKD
jgi:hypothetical protein